MDIRNIGNFQGGNHGSIRSLKGDQKPPVKGDSFTAGPVDEGKIISPQVFKSVAYTAKDVEIQDKQPVSSGETATVNTMAGSTMDSSINAASAAIQSPAAGAVLQKTGEVLTPLEQKAYSIIAGSSKDEKEAKANFDEFKSLMTKDMNPAEMADFYVFGNNFYEKDNKDREYLMRESMKGIHKFISDKKGTYKDTTRAERVECLKILMEAIPPGEQHYVLNNGDTLRPFYYIKETLNDDKTPNKGSFNFGYEMMQTEFSPPDKPDPDLVGAHRMFAKWMKILQHAENRESPKYRTNDDTDGFHTLRIVRACLNYDPDKTAELEDLMGVTGSPWNSLGIIKLLDDVDPALRGEAKTKTMEEIRKTDMEHNSIGAAARSIAGIYSLMQPGEEFDKTREQLNTISEDILTHPVWSNYRYNSMSAYTSKLINDQLKSAGKFREPGESLPDSYKRLKPVFNDMMDGGMSVESFNDFYRMMGENKENLKEAIPGTKTYGDVNREVVKIVKEEWFKWNLPADNAADFIKMGLKERKPGQPLQDVCKQLAFEYRLMGDFQGSEKIEEMVDKGFKAGDFTGVERKEIIDDMTHHIKLRRMTGEKPEEAMKKAYDQVKDIRNKKAEEKMKIEKSGDSVIIGGVRLPRRKI